MAGRRGTEAGPLDAGLGTVAHSLVTVDTVLFSVTYFLLGQRRLGLLTWNILRCSARHSAEARHLVPGVQERCCGDLARSGRSSREILEGFVEEACFELERWKAERGLPW